MVISGSVVVHCWIHSGELVDELFHELVNLVAASERYAGYFFKYQYADKTAMS